MAIKRLTEGFGIGQDSCISGTHPMREDDIRNGTSGLYLGPNPESPATGLFITYWEADEIAQKIGFPHIEVYKEQKRLIDEQAAEIAELEHRLDKEIHNEQMKSVLSAVSNVKKEVLRELEAYSGAVRARLGSVGSDPKRVEGKGVIAAGTAKAVGKQPL